MHPQEHLKDFAGTLQADIAEHPINQIDALLP